MSSAFTLYVDRKSLIVYFIRGIRSRRSGISRPAAVCVSFVFTVRQPSASTEHAYNSIVYYSLDFSVRIPYI